MKCENLTIGGRSDGKSDRMNKDLFVLLAYHDH